MNNIEIENILKVTRYVKDIFMGVFSVDTLHRHVKLYPSCYIVNTDESTESGEHWVCVYFNSNGIAEFFCSFGNNPSFYDYQMVSFMERNCYLWKCNSKRLQSCLSTVCGQYCIFFAICKVLYVHMDKFCSLFSKNCQMNDVIVNEFVCINFDVELPVIDVEFLKSSLLM